MATQFANGKIVTDGLILCLDAADQTSYPTTGTTWNDLVGSNNGTLINGPTFSSGNGGSIVFDGVDDRAATQFSILSGVEATINIIVSPISNTTGYYIAQSTGTGGGRFLISSSSGRNFSMRIGSNSIITEGQYNQWFILSVVRESDGLTTFYKNGTIVGTFTNTFNFTNNILDIGGSHFVPDRSSSSRISSVQIYNRALTVSEVLQNYNAQKGRFGLS
jgi:hypothetical protein